MRGKHMRHKLPPNEQTRTIAVPLAVPVSVQRRSREWVPRSHSEGSSATYVTHGNDTFVRMHELSLVYTAICTRLPG